MLVLVVKCVIYKAISLSALTFNISTLTCSLRNHNVDPNYCMWCVQMFYVCVLIFLEMAGFCMRMLCRVLEDLEYCLRGGWGWVFGW